jgi:hypothetical protein
MLEKVAGEIIFVESPMAFVKSTATNESPRLAKAPIRAQDYCLFIQYLRYGHDQRLSGV